MKSIFTFALSLFALTTFGQKKACAVMSPISQFSGQPVGQLQLLVSAGSSVTILTPVNSGGCLQLVGLPNLTGNNLAPFKNINPTNGVSTFDLVKISQSILGTGSPLSCFQLIAADINRNGVVSTFDLLELRKIILGIYTTFPSNTSWRFVSKNCTTPCTGPCPTCVFGGSTNFDCEFFGIKIGDLTGDANPNNFVGDLSEDRGSAVFSLENRSLKAGQTAETPFFLEKENSLLAWQFALKFDPDFIEILQSADAVKETLPDLLDGSEAMPMVVRTAPGRVAMNWFSAAPRTFSSGRDALISLKIKVLRDCKLSDVLFLEPVRPEGGNENLSPEVFFEDETSQSISLIFSEKKESVPAQNLAAWPNPFSEKTTLVWSQDSAGEAIIEVFDATGRAVFSKKVLGEKGANHFGLEGFSEGLFFVKINAVGEFFSTKIECR